jgi:hypothetical protein
VAASAAATSAIAVAFQNDSMPDWALRSASALSRAAVRIGGCQHVRNGGECHGLAVLVGERLGEAFRAVRVGSCQRHYDVRERLYIRRFVDDGLRRAFRVGAEQGGAVWVGGCQHPGDIGERRCLLPLVGDGPGGEFRLGQDAGAAGLVVSDSFKVLLGRSVNGIPAAAASDGVPYVVVPLSLGKSCRRSAVIADAAAPAPVDHDRGTEHDYERDHNVKPEKHRHLPSGGPSCVGLSVGLRRRPRCIR